MRKGTLAFVAITAFAAVVPAAATAAPTVTNPVPTNTPALTASEVIAASPALQAAMAADPGGQLSFGEMSFATPPAASTSDAVTPDNSVQGNCGTAWLYDTDGSDAGTINETAGMNLDYPILYGAGNIAWENATNGRGNEWDFTVSPNISGVWGGTRGVDTGKGVITSYLNSAVVTVLGTCTTNGTVFSTVKAT